MQKVSAEFEGRMQYENFQFFFRPHWISFFWLFARGGIMLILGIALMQPTISAMSQIESEAIRSLIGFLYMIISYISISYFFMLIINYYYRLVIVTDHRMIIMNKSLYILNNRDTIDLVKIQDIGVEARGLFSNYLHYGKLVITLASINMPIVIQCAPHPHETLEQINRIKRIQIIKRQHKGLMLQEGTKISSMEK